MYKELITRNDKYGKIEFILILTGKEVKEFKNILYGKTNELLKSKNMNLYQFEIHVKDPNNDNIIYNGLKVIKIGNDSAVDTLIVNKDIKDIKDEDIFIFSNLKTKD